MFANGFLVEAKAIAQLCNDVRSMIVGEWYILTKSCKSNTFHIISDLLNSENPKVAVAQLCNELQVCNFTMNFTGL